MKAKLRVNVDQRYRIVVDGALSASLERDRFARLLEILKIFLRATGLLESNFSVGGDKLLHLSILQNSR